MKPNLLNGSGFCGRRHHIFDIALSRGKLRGSGLVRECCISATAYASDVPPFSRTSQLPQNPVSSVAYRLFDKRGLGLGGNRTLNDNAVYQENPVIVHRRQAASHSSGLQQDTTPSLKMTSEHGERPDHQS
ncbi:hypothetical protein ACTACK_25035 [Pseudomonas syringae]|uniref:hypothetical protein n=1 Tax=Pseudomonas syringae TaxID=317 RepID=UPI003F74B4EF